MPSLFRNWLYYKPFTDDDILELENKAESFTLGLIQVTSIIAHKKKLKTMNKEKSKNPFYRYRDYRGRYNKKAYEEVRKLFKRVLARQTQDELEQHIEEAEDFLDDRIIQRIDAVIIEIIEPRISDKLKADFQAILTEEGIRRTAAKERHIWKVDLSLKLWRFTIDADLYPLNKKAAVSVRASLANLGQTHKKCVLRDFRHCEPDEPCRRVALEYRILDNHDGNGPSVWRWAWKRSYKSYGKSIAEPEKRQAKEAKYLYRLNAVVNIFEGRDLAEIHRTPRRCLEYQW